MKTKANPNGDWSEQETYEMFAAIAQYISLFHLIAANAKSAIGTFTSTLTLPTIGASVKLLKSMARRLWT